MEEANHRTENLKAENSAAREGLIRQVEELRSSHAATIAQLEEANHRNEKNEEMIEVIAKENEELVKLADQRSDYVITLANERNQAKSE